MKKITILGSTGSIGTQTLEIVKEFPNNFEIQGLTCNKNIDLLEKQIIQFKPKYVCVMDKEAAKELEARILPDIIVYTGLDGLINIATESKCDILLTAVVGSIGLLPTYEAIKKGIDIALANKETLVTAGKIIMAEAKKSGSKILPVDSEHSAIFQCLQGNEKNTVEKIILTASGGAFLDTPFDDLKSVKPVDALKHPNWEMGKKITIDSATMMNKGLEVIEAHWLFKQSYDKIKVVVHPQSIIHSMVEFKDNAIMAEMGVSDMRLAIQNVITYPKRYESPVKTLDLFSVGQLNFVRPDFKKFPALRLAYQAGKEGGSFPAVLNAANEVAVQKFLKKEISYLQITQLIEKVMHKHKNINEPQPSELFAVDRWSRKVAREVAECL